MYSLKLLVNSIKQNVKRKNFCKYLLMLLFIKITDQPDNWYN